MQLRAVFASEKPKLHVCLETVSFQCVGTAWYIHRLKTDSEAIRDSETMIQKLFGPIQKLFGPIQKLRFRNYLDRFRNYLHRFRNYFVRFRNYDSETILSDSETTIQKLFRPIQKQRFRNYFARFRNYFARFRNCDSATIRPIQKLLYFAPYDKMNGVTEGKPGRDMC